MPLACICLPVYPPIPPVQKHTCIFSQESCDNDDDYHVGLRIELPPGVEGCLRPESPPNSFLRVKSDLIDRS